MKQMRAQFSLEHTEIVLIINCEPEMGDRIDIPLYGSCIITGLNDEHKGTDQTWLMVQCADQTSQQFQYIKNKDHDNDQ